MLYLNNNYNTVKMHLKKIISFILTKKKVSKTDIGNAQWDQDRTTQIYTWPLAWQKRLWCDGVRKWSKPKEKGLLITNVINTQ
jgi:hypothetical protein